jgi:hypothetical protein
VAGSDRLQLKSKMSSLAMQNMLPGLKVFPRIRLFQRALQSKKYYTNGTHEALISAWNRGTSATRALNAQPPLFRLLATPPNMTWGGLRAGKEESYGKQFQGAP